MSANDTQVAGDHYRAPIQHWDWAAGFYGAWYFRVQATRYLSRWRKKGGVQDLQKAHHYLLKYVEIMARPTLSVPEVAFTDFTAANQLCAEDVEILRLVAFGDLRAVSEAIDKLESMIAAEPTSAVVSS